MYADRPIRIRVPATSANLGPGFDCLGLALGLTDEIVAAVSEEPGFAVDVQGEGADSLPLDGTHLVARSIAQGFEAMEVPLPGISLRCLNAIPHGRGLGSSAAAIVGGLLAARGLVRDGSSRLSDEALLDIATSMEGHPDNVAAAMYGAVTVAIVDSDISDGRELPHVTVVRHVPQQDLVAIIAIPPRPLSTEKARALLPATVSHGDAAFNVGRAAVLTTALTRDTTLLMLATEDRLHQQSRASAYPESLALVSDLRARGIAAVISGAGPTVLALSQEPAPTLTAVAELVPQGWVVVALAPDIQGARRIA